MKKITIFVALIILATHVFSQALGYNNNRIAISADGNNQADNSSEAQWPRADPDDWGGTPVSLAMIVKANLKDKLVHFSYNNFIGAPVHTTETNYMADGVNGAIQRWGFDATRFFDVPVNNEIAITHLANELKKSTATDPLYFIHMGPSEFFYQAVKQVVDGGNIDALAYVYVISHSGYNDTHLRRLAHHTMPQAIELSGNRIQYKKIKDQNACDLPDVLWCAGTDFTPFYWMRDHIDPNIKWLYSRMQFHPSGRGADVSDAGMVWYLLKSDEDGNLSKFNTFIGEGIPTDAELKVQSINVTPTTLKLYTNRSAKLVAAIIPTNATNTKVLWTSSNNTVAVVSATGTVTAKSQGEASIVATTDDGGFKASTPVTVADLPECTTTTLVGINDFEMSKIDPFVIAYKDNGRNAVAVDAGLYKNQFAATQKVYQGNTGFYNITFTTLTEEDGESTYRFKVNGQLIGEFQNPVAVTDMAEYKYTFKNVLVETGDVLQIESNTHSNGKIPEGTGFAFSRGRWRSIFFECMSECKVEETNGLLVFEAERFPLKGQWKLGLDETKASGGQYIYYAGANSYSAPNSANTISYTFKINNPGNYTVKWNVRQPEGQRGSDLGNDVWIYFSNDIGWGGTTQLTGYEKFYGRSDDNFAFNGIAEVHGATHSWLTAKFPAAGEYTINISGRSAGIQLDRIILYKGISFDEAQLQINNLSETSSCSVVEPLVIKEATAFVGLPAEFSSKQTEIPVKISYSANEPRDIVVDIKSPNNTVVQTKTISVGRGISTTNFSFGALTTGNGYKIEVALRTLGGSSATNIVTAEATFNVVDGVVLPTADKVSFIDVPTRIPQSQLTIPIKVHYAATQARDVNIELKQTVYITSSLVKVPAGEGDTTIIITLPSQLDLALNYKFILTIRPVGGDWQTNISKIESAFNVTNSTRLNKIYSSLEVFPNPFRNEISFHNDGQIRSVQVYDITGKELLIQSVLNQTNTIDLTNYDKGAYILKFNFIDSNYPSYIQKVIKI